LRLLDGAAAGGHRGWLGNPETESPEIELEDLQ
jgi:hypothetical protein